jgi:hypothetical protein
LSVAFSFAAISFGKLHFNLDVNPILMHLAGFSHSMRHWVVCQNLPCSETCCWWSHKLCRWVHSMWIPVATSQKMVSTAVVTVWLSCFNMGCSSLLYGVLVRCACMACIPPVCYLLSHGITAECHSCRLSGLVLPSFIINGLHIAAM